MSEKKEDKTITMTEEQLERVIKSAVKNALNELKDEGKLPGNEEDELKSAPVTFAIMCGCYILGLSLLIVLSLCVVWVCVNIIFQDGFDLGIISYAIVFILLAVFAVMSIKEIVKTKKIVVLSTAYSGIMALSSLIVAFFAAVFTYLAL